MLHFRWTSDLAILSQEFEAWDRLANGIPFRESKWLIPWWNNLATNAFPVVVTGRDEKGELRALLPLYRTENHSDGRVLHNFGHGDTCSDFTSLLVDPALDSGEVASQTAHFMTNSAPDSEFGWEAVEFDGISDSDEIMSAFAGGVVDSGSSLHCHSEMHTWFIPCKSSFDSYLGEFKRDKRSRHRGMLRRLHASDELQTDNPDCIDGTHRLLDEVIDLHQERWQSVGESGSFASTESRRFMHEVADRFNGTSSFWITGIRRNRKLIAGTVMVIGGNGRAYCYFAGVDMSQAKAQPGNMLNLYVIEQAHQKKLAGIDFMRGDECYKSRLHAEKSRMIRMRVAAPQQRSQLRHAAWVAKFETKRFMRRCLGRTSLEVVNYGPSVSA